MLSHALLAREPVNIETLMVSNMTPVEHLSVFFLQLLSEYFCS